MLVVNFYFLAVSGSESDYNDRPSQQRFCFFFWGVMLLLNLTRHQTIEH